MNLNKENWTKDDIKEFNNYIESIKREDKIEFSRKVVNTKMKVLGINNPTCKEIAKKIHEGNFRKFLEKNNFKYYESTLVSAYLINYIKDINEKEIEINRLKMDNWATVDSLTFDIKKQEEEYLELSKKYILEKETFKRRVGVRILFSFTKTEYVDEIFKIIDSMKDEEEYYVNMAVAWLGCELIIKNREKTLEYLKKNNLNEFTINKMVSKCRDSFRVSKEDKELLLKYRK